MKQEITEGENNMKFIRNLSIKWKLMLPIALVTFLLLATCLQSNIATKRTAETSLKLSEHLTEITPEIEALLATPAFEGTKE